LPTYMWGSFGSPGVASVLDVMRPYVSIPVDQRRDRTRHTCLRPPTASYSGILAESLPQTKGRTMNTTEHPSRDDDGLSNPRGHSTLVVRIVLMVLFLVSAMFFGSYFLMDRGVSFSWFNNIGLMSERQTGMIISGIASVAFLITWLVLPNRRMYS
jgi:hypothetical protein